MHTLATQATTAWKTTHDQLRSAAEQAAATDITALAALLQELGIQPIQQPLIDNDGTVIALIFRGDRSTAAHARYTPPRASTLIRVWACAHHGVIWLRHATGIHHPIDEHEGFSSLQDLGRALTNAALTDL
jgi:hypothetical protein